MQPQPFRFQNDTHRNGKFHLLIIRLHLDVGHLSDATAKQLCLLDHGQADLGIAITRHQAVDDRLLEIPITTVPLGGRNLNCGGGGWFRLFPYPFSRWALNRVYKMRVNWDCAKLASAEPEGDTMILTFDKGVMPDNSSPIPEGFSIAGEDGKFCMAHARHRAEGSYWDRTKIIHVWSPLVEKPVAVRYGWAWSPMGNLKVGEHQDLPIPSFRTDSWDWPKSEDHEVIAVGRAEGNEMKEEAIERCEYRRTEEAKRAVEILERIKTLGRRDAAEGS